MSLCAALAAAAVCGGLTDNEYFEGTVFTLPLPAATVAGLLPDGIEPALGRPGFAPGTHPVTFNFLLQSHVGSPFTDYTYKEFILSVPFVQWDDAHAAAYKYRGPFIYHPKLYLNETAEVKLGHEYPGDNKEYALLSRELSDAGGTFRVVGNASHPFAGEVIVEANWTAPGPARPPAEVPGFTDQHAAGYTLPSIGRYPPDSGKWVCLPFKYFLNQTEPGTGGRSQNGVPVPGSFIAARVAPAGGTFAVRRPFAGGGAGTVPTGEHSVKPLAADGGFGGFTIAVAWDYSEPRPFARDCAKFDPGQN